MFSSLLCALDEVRRITLRSASARPLRWYQPSPQQIQIGQSEHGEQARGVLDQTPIAYLRKAPEVLHHVEGMLAASPGGRANAVDGALVPSELVTVVTAAVDPITDAAGESGLPMRLAPVGLVSKDFALITMQQMHHLTDVRLVGGRCYQAVNDPVPVGAHVRLHPEAPLALGLLALPHLWVARLGLVLGRGGASIIVASTIVPL